MTCHEQFPQPDALQPGEAIEALFAARGQRITVRRGQTLVDEEQPIDAVYRVVSGYVRGCSYARDGRRQVFDFAGPGSLLGFPDLGLWQHSIEAVDAVVLQSVHPEVLEGAVSRDRAIQQDLRRHCLGQIARRERHLVWLAYLRTEDRLLAFLEDFAQTGPVSGGIVELPMTRQDLADHLGMTLETVSRCFTALREHGAITMDGTYRYGLRPAIACLTAA